MDEHPVVAGINSEKGNHVLALDGLRGVAVLLVLWAHWTPSLGTTFELVKRGLQPAYVGVDVFFVLSGYLVTLSLLRLRSEADRWRIFWFKRAKRILPIYLLTVVVCHFLGNGKLTIPSLFFIQNFWLSFDMQPSPLRHTWSLAVEEHFYLLWPVVVFLRQKSAERVAICVSMTAIASSTLLPVFFEQQAGELLYRSTAARSLSMCLGAMIALRTRDVHRPQLLILGTGLVALLLVWFLGPASFFVAMVKYLAGALVSYGVVQLVLNKPNSMFSNWLCFRPLTFIGTISYGVYLFHYPLFYAAGAFAPNPHAWPLVLALIATLVISTCSYRLFERPIMQWRAR